MVINQDPKLYNSFSPSFHRPSQNGAVSNPQVLPNEYYTKFLSAAAKRRKPNPIRDLIPLEKTPGLISLLAGKPNPETFPFSSISATVSAPSSGGGGGVGAFQVTLEGDELTEALQYGIPPGLPPLVEWLRGLQEFSHGRKVSPDWGLSVGSGSLDLIYKAATALLNPGDTVLMDSPTYTNTIGIFESLGCETVGVETDRQGISSESLRWILETWPVGKPKPQVLYTVPYGCNPTGMTASKERRQEVLRLAREHDFLILEDDPYYYVYYGDAPRPPSYFTLELEQPQVGRVLRFDSLSKVVSSGIRIGFASGPIPLLQAIDLHTSTSSVHIPSLTQALVFKLLDSWGYDGFKLHAEKVSDFYRIRRDAFECAMKQHLTGLAEWSTPESGMFFWFKLFLSADHNVEGDSEVAMRQKAVEHGVLALPGIDFLPDRRKNSYVRASFSLSNEEQIYEGVKRLRQIVLSIREAKVCQ